MKDQGLTSVKNEDIVNDSLLAVALSASKDNKILSKLSA
jgi:hypothetical protein